MQADCEKKRASHKLFFRAFCLSAVRNFLLKKSLLASKKMQLTNSQNRTEKAPRFPGGTEISTRYQTRANKRKYAFFPEIWQACFLRLNIHDFAARSSLLFDTPRPNPVNASGPIQVTSCRQLSYRSARRRSDARQNWRVEKAAQK